MSYSDWQKIDLHLHTDWSRKTKENDYNGAFSVTTLKQKLKENQVSIFSLTDHNIINIDAYNDYYDGYNELEDPLLLLGVELDIVVNTETRGEKTYHSLIIFNYSDKVNTALINDKLEKKFIDKGLDSKLRTLNIDEVIELFPEEDFFFIPHAGNTKSILDGYKENIEDAQKMVLLMPSAFEKVKEAARQQYNKGFDRVLEYDFKEKNDIPYINFSDNHNIDQYPCTNKGGAESKIHDFYFLKGDKSFEALRLAFIDPESRIKSEKELKEIRPSFNYIEGVKITDNTILEDCELRFSPHLNTLIGGRSSGKSLLMTILGDKIDSVSVEKKKYDIDFDQIEIKSKFDMLYKDKASITKDEIIYIKQGDIVRYFEEKKLEDLAKEANKTSQYLETKTAFKEHKRTFDEIIEQYLNEYGSCRYEINQKFILHNATIENLLSQQFVFKWDKNKVFEIVDKTKSISESKALLEILNTKHAELKGKSILEFTEDEIVILNNFQILLNHKVSFIEKLEERNNKKLSFLNFIDPIVAKINSQLTEEARSKSESRKVVEDLNNNINKRFKSLASLRNACIGLQQFEYSVRHNIEINEDVKLILEIEKSQNILDLILEGIQHGDNSSSLYSNTIDLLNSKKSIKNYNDNSIDSLRKKTRKQLQDLLNSYDNPSDFLEYENGETSKKNSPGYNSEKYLEIILKNPKSKIIFIDQPEDNLGNKFITDTLVKLIREIKFNKQIFLVTHNPSIVVYGDSESIIIASNENNKISYRQVVLENQNAQKEICGILDGGEYIFNMRSKKYNIKRILNNN